MKKSITLILFIIILILIASCQHNNTKQKKVTKKATISNKVSKDSVTPKNISSSSNSTTSTLNKNPDQQNLSEKDTSTLTTNGNPNISKYQIFNQNWYAIYEKFISKDPNYANMNVALSISKDNNLSGGSSIYTGTFYQYGKSGMQYIKIYINSGSATVRLLNAPKNSTSGSSNISPYIRAILKYSMQNSTIPEKLYR
ncbi:MAG: hypothetical protein NTX05_01665 [Fusobacteria bacterium]|nr:hypothetical protein [Fusobacteriota bacterium]